MNPATLAVLLIFGPVVVAVVGTFVIIWKWLSAKHNNQLQAEETRLMQEIYQGLSRMEERVEALETLLFDRQRKEGRK
jgi:phage shock protein B